MQNYSIENLRNKKVAIECDNFTEAKKVIEIFKAHSPGIMIMDAWVETLPFLFFGGAFQFIKWAPAYYCKNLGCSIIPASEFIKQNSLSLDPEATQSIERNCDSTVQQQTIVPDARWKNREKHYMATHWHKHLLEDTHFGILIKNKDNYALINWIISTIGIYRYIPPYEDTTAPLVFHPRLMAAEYEDPLHMEVTTIYTDEDFIGFCKGEEKKEDPEHYLKVFAPFMSTSKDVIFPASTPVLFIMGDVEYLVSRNNTGLIIDKRPRNTGPEAVIQSWDTSAPIKDCSETLGVGAGAGKLFVYGDHESIRMCQRKLLELETLRLSSYSLNDLYKAWNDTRVYFLEEREKEQAFNEFLGRCCAKEVQTEPSAEDLKLWREKYRESLLEFMSADDLEFRNIIKEFKLTEEFLNAIPAHQHAMMEKFIMEHIPFADIEKSICDFKEGSAASKIVSRVYFLLLMGNRNPNPKRSVAPDAATEKTLPATKENFLITITRGPLNEYTASMGKYFMKGATRYEAMGKLIESMSKELKITILQS